MVKYEQAGQEALLMEHVLRVLEYDKMKAQLIGFVASSLGKQRVQALKPLIDLDDVQLVQNETAEISDIIRLKGHVPLGGISDIKAHVKRAAIGGVLSASELTEIASTLYGSKQLKYFF